MLSNEEFLKRDFIRGDPKLEVTFALAQKAHEDQIRKDGSIGIEHPMLVCNLLDWLGGKLGENVEVEKAVALLHDAVEDNKEYRKNPLKFKAQLQEDLREKFGLSALTSPTPPNSYTGRMKCLKE